MLKILFILALRSLRSHRITTAIVGSVILFGSWLLITGTALTESLESSLSKTLISSVAGHLQVYASDARDDLALFGSGFSAEDDIGEMADFARVRDVLYQDRNVAAVVPMGIATHALVSGNELDRVLRRLAQVARQGHGGRFEAIAKQVRDIAADIQRETEARAVIAADGDHLTRRLAALRQVQTAAFWQMLRADPEPGLQFLDTQLAPLAGTVPPVYLRDLGTDIAAFTRHFDRFQLVDGHMPPPGHRGLLLAKAIYETELKHPVARALDVLHKGIIGEHRSLDNDPALREQVDRLPLQSKSIRFQLNPEDTSRLTDMLRAFLHVTDPTADLTILLEEFLVITDANFLPRYQFFYQTIAPMIRLYSVNMGDSVTISAITRGGYVKNVNVRVWGTFQLSGLEKSPAAGLLNIMDLVTFRDLYGAHSKSDESELAAMRRSVAVQDIDRDDAEALMFADTTVRAERKTQGRPQRITPKVFSEVRRLRGSHGETFNQLEIDNGLALNAAVLLKEPKKLSSTRIHLTKLLRDARLPVQVVDWRDATGVLSRFVTAVHLFLYVSTGVIFLVALVIMSNAMTMATAERAREIGTIRAIGGQRGVIITMYVFETLSLGLMAGGLGALAGAATVTMLRQRGIPALSDVMVFMFSGPRFYPHIALSHMGFGLVVVLLVTLVSTLYPAYIAAHITPRVAMQAKE